MGRRSRFRHGDPSDGASADATTDWGQVCQAAVMKQSLSERNKEFLLMDMSRKEAACAGALSVVDVMPPRTTPLRSGLKRNSRSSIRSRAGCVRHQILGRQVLLKEQIKPEMHQSIVEAHGNLHLDAVRARRRRAAEQARLARTRRMRIASVGTHPFSNWRTNSPTERYKEIVKTCNSRRRT